MLLRGVSWEAYEHLLSLIGDGPQRMTYDRGLLEIEMPSRAHEHAKFLAGQFIVAYLEEFGIAYEAEMSTTWHRDGTGGLEADESYYIANVDRIRGKEIDLAVDPPPDLAIEIDLSTPLLEKASVYARLGVPEIWRWRDGRLLVVERAGGHYVERSTSKALPGFPLEKLAVELEKLPHPDQAAAARAFRRWCREAAEIA
ncbi:MAG: Uma2 family endonuclease [Planctomycetota bacterium]